MKEKEPPLLIFLPLLRGTVEEHTGLITESGLELERFTGYDPAFSTAGQPAPIVIGQ